MNKEFQNQGQGLAGTEPYGTVEGARFIGSALADYHGKGIELAPPSGVAYVQPYDSCHFIRENEVRCGAPRAKQTDFCIGHLNAFEKMQKAQDAQENETKEDE